VKSKKNGKEKVASLAVAINAIAAQGRAKQAELDQVIERVNTLLEKSDSCQDEVANLLFEAAWEGDIHAALGNGVKPTIAYTYLLDSAVGGALKMDPSRVRRAVRVGALNRKLDGSPWSGLGFTMKAELLPLQSDASNFHPLLEGARHAVQAGASTRAMRDWVAQRVGGAAHAPKSPAVPSAAASAKILDVGALLGAGSQRDLWVTRVIGMPPAERQHHLAQVKAAAQNFDALAKSIEATLAALSG
jgi:hypothetical protein